MALYTGKGDKGTTKLFDSPKGERISKTSEIFEALGTLDELGAILGWCKVWCPSDMKVGGRICAEVIHEIQNNIFTIQAEVAGAKKYITKEHIRDIEAQIAVVEKKLPEIQSFFIPGGTEMAVRFEIARTIARRAERRILVVHESDERKLGEYTLAYMNRLSSLLYSLTRFSNYLANVDEEAPRYQSKG